MGESGHPRGDCPHPWAGRRFPCPLDDKKKVRRLESRKEERLSSPDQDFPWFAKEYPPAQGRPRLILRIEVSQHGL